jgi:hypothetical protein
MRLEILSKVNANAVRSHIEKFKEKINKTILLNLQIIGEEFITEARTKTQSQGGFQDHSGNLRSSIGYVILYNGEQVFGGEFIKVLDGGEGAEKGSQLLKNLSSDHPTGWVLIGCAGMEYSVYVEAKGRDVISGSANIAGAALKKAVERINKKAVS